MEQLSYALGMVIGQNLKDMGIAQFDDEKFTTAVRHILTDAKPEMTMAEAHQQVAAYLQAKEAEKGKVAREAGERFLAENAKKEGVKTLPTGVQYKVIKEGNGPIPADTSLVKVHYVGRTLEKDGEFDNSYNRKEPVTMRCNQVIKGFTDALTHMPEGSTWEIYIPQNLAYGEREQGKIKPFSVLIFKLELIKVNPK